MIYDVLEVFRKEYDVKGDKLILDNYQLKDGLYVKVSENGGVEYFIAKIVKKERIFTHLNGNINHKMLEWFKERDYYSGYLNSNKSFYDKKIHNVNYLSFFVKIESFTSTDPKKLLDKNAIRGQYQKLCNYKKFEKPKEQEIVKNYQAKLDDRKRRKDVIKKYRFVQKHIQTIVEIAKANNVSNYIKIFFEAGIGEYKEESNYYYAIKIFNDIEYSKGNYGLSDSNMGLNAKKPYLVCKTRKVIDGKPIAPFMILNTDAMLIKKFFDWLKFQEYKNKYPAGDQFFINRDFKEKDIVTDFDFLPVKIEKFDNSIYHKNHLKITINKTLIDDNTIDKLSQLEAIVDEILYNNQLIYNYYGEVYKKLDNSFANLIYMTRDAMINYFRKYNDREFHQIIQKYGNDFVVEHLRQKREFKARESMNLILSLKQHDMDNKKQGEKIMDINAIQKKMIEKLETSNYDSLDKDEFFYLCGQVAKYLLSQSEQFSKNIDMLEPYLRASNVEKLKKSIEADFFKYKHKIPLGYVKFGNAMSIIMAYDGKERLLQHMDNFLVGILSQNIFYMKKEE